MLSHNLSSSRAILPEIMLFGANSSRRSGGVVECAGMAAIGVGRLQRHCFQLSDQLFSTLKFKLVNESKATTKTWIALYPLHSHAHARTHTLIRKISASRIWQELARIQPVYTHNRRGTDATRPRVAMRAGVRLSVVFAVPFACVQPNTNASINFRNKFPFAGWGAKSCSHPFWP